MTATAYSSVHDVTGPGPSAALASIGREMPRVVSADAWRIWPGHVSRLSAQPIAARWTSSASGEVRQAARHADHLLVDITLRHTALRLWLGNELVHEGRLSAGAVQVTLPGVEAVAEFSEPADYLQLFVPAAWLGEFLPAPDGPDLGRSTGRPVRDLVVERLAGALLKTGELGSRPARVYADGLIAALVARVVSRTVARVDAPARRASELVKWRLTRVLNHIEARLEDPISLADLARVAGLSRMHFAAQFRRATGMRPHAFVTHRRIARAQQLLRESDMPLVEVALSVGFQTQAHFTTIFRQLMSETPGRWRALQQAG